VPLLDLSEPGGYKVQGLVPCRLPEAAPVPDEGPGEPVRVVDELVGAPPLDAELALAGAFLSRGDRDDPAVPDV
jgi:hypothetical protein